MRSIRRGLALVAVLTITACATTSAPGNSTSYADALVGRFANLRNDHEAAAERYSAALARRPGNDALITGGIAASLAAGDEARARQFARQASRDGAPALVHIVRAADALAAGRPRDADAQLMQAEGTAAQELIAHMMLVWARVGDGRVEQVLVDLRQLARIQPYGTLFAYQQAMALDLAGRTSEATAAYSIASEGTFWLAPAVERHADLLARNGNREEAIRLLRLHAERANPSLTTALARLEAGAPAASTPLTAARGAAAAMYGMALVFQEENDANNALTSLTIALMLDPDLDIARITRARAQAKAGHIALARADLARIAQTSPYQVNARLTEAWILADAGQNEEALAVARANAEGGSIAARRTLADMYRRQMRFDEAEPIYTALIQESPRDWRLHFARGVARQQLDRWPEAEADLRHALELQPEQPEVLNYLGYTWIERGEHLQEGLVMVRRAVELRPESGIIIDSLAWAYYQLGDYPRALETMERALLLEPAQPVLNEHLGDIYWRLGRRVEARFQWQRALSLEHEDPAAVQAKLANGLPDVPPTRSATR